MAAMTDDNEVEWRRGGYAISTDKARVDRAAVKRFLDASYWAAGIPEDVVERSIAGALVFGVYAAGGEQVGLARVITDSATFAYLSDVWIEPAHRGKGLSKWLVETILAHESLRGLRRWILATKDAHALYAKSGFRPLAEPSWWMEIVEADPYGRAIKPPPRPGS